MNENHDTQSQPVMAELVVQDFLNAADTLIELGDVTQAELRLRDALRKADSSFGHNSRVVRRVLTALLDFYKSQDRREALATVEKRLELLGPPPAGDEDPVKEKKDPNNSHGKLLALKPKGERNLPSTGTSGVNTRIMPAEIRRACQILGLAPEDINESAVGQAWKRAISDPSVHPDLGGAGRGSYSSQSIARQCSELAGTAETEVA